jgi:type VI secretion system secreted protein VgrG
LFISADEQAKAQGEVLEMAAALGRLQKAGDQLQGLSSDAQTAHAEPADVQAQLAFLREQIDALKAQVILLSAP